MDNEEFRWAMGDTVHRRMMRDFRLYMLVGGMPQAVAQYIKTNNLAAVDSVKRDIVSLYIEDLNKIDPSGRASRMYQFIPAQLSKNASRYQVGAVIEGENPDRVADQFKVSPIEVQSSGYKSHASLDEFCRKYSDRIQNKYLIYTKDLQKEQSVLYLPVYMTMFL